MFASTQIFVPKDRGPAVLVKTEMKKALRTSAFKDSPFQRMWEKATSPGRGAARKRREKLSLAANPMTCFQGEAQTELMVHSPLSDIKQTYPALCYCWGLWCFIPGYNCNHTAQPNTECALPAVGWPTGKEKHPLTFDPCSWCASGKDTDAHPSPVDCAWTCSERLHATGHGM